MNMNKMPIISLRHDDADALGQQLGDSFKTYGFATVVDHGSGSRTGRQGVGLDQRAF